jgi:hypothetical protein
MRAWRDANGTARAWRVALGSARQHERAHAGAGGNEGGSDKGLHGGNAEVFLSVRRWQGVS